MIDSTVFTKSGCIRVSQNCRNFMSITKKSKRGYKAYKKREQEFKQKTERLLAKGKHRSSEELDRDLEILVGIK